MDLLQKIRTIPTEPGVYLYKNAEGEVIYVGKAKTLRSRVASYFHEGRWEDSKTGTLVREAVDVDYIVVANNKEALALENNLIKQRKPRFNILLRDDKTYPYVKLTLGERWPRVYVTRRLRKDGSAYYGPLLPCQSRLPHRRSDSPQFSHSVVQGGSHALPSASLPAVLHQALSGSVREGLDHAGRISGGSPRREAVSRRPSHRFEQVAAYSHGAGSRSCRSMSAPRGIAT
jgi:hypothetical protein